MLCVDVYTIFDIDPLIHSLVNLLGKYDITTEVVIIINIIFIYTPNNNRKLIINANNPIASTNANPNIV